MYELAHFKNDELAVQAEVILSNPLGVLVVNTAAGFEVNHIPFMLDIRDGIASCLRAHIPKNNPLSNVAISPVNCVAVFQGAQGYISPSWYATKKEHCKVVPTWNYQVVHVHGELRVIDDADWVLQQLNDLTTLNERSRDHPWAVSDAPEKYTAARIHGLVGLELQIKRIDGKTKASQNQPIDNKRSVIAAMADEMPDTPFAEMMKANIGDDEA